MGIDPRGDRSVYLQVADTVRADIVSGRLRPGDNLPSEKQLGDALDVGREAVRQGLAILRAEGLVSTERGFGSRVRELPQRRTVKLKRGDTITARMPTEPERRTLDLEEGVPLLVLTHADGTIDEHAADAIALTY